VRRETQTCWAIHIVLKDENYVCIYVVNIVTFGTYLSVREEVKEVKQSCYRPGVAQRVPGS